MRIKLVSDLHLEFSDILIKNDQNYDVLILSGDILVASKVLKPLSEQGVRFREFLKRCSFQFPHVIYVAGNHEFYDSGKFFEGIDILRAACGVYDNIYFLERDTKVIDDIVFIGGTLWTDLNRGDPITMHAIRDMMNDYRAIRNDKSGYVNLKPSDTAERHIRTKEYIELILKQNADKKCVVVTHHAPTYQSVSEYYRQDYVMNGAYYSELSEMILDHPQIALWTHGHMHQPFDYMVGTTRVVCNPRGYESGHYNEDTGWNPDILIEV